jgi:signal transduction histidine kinase
LVTRSDTSDVESQISAGISRVNATIDKAELGLANAILDSMTVLADSIQNLDLKSKVVAQRGLVYAYQSRFNDAISILEEYLPIAEEYSNQNVQFLYNMRLASMYEQIGNGEKALEYIDNATAFPPDILTSDERFGSMITKASILSENRRFAEAIDFYQQAISMADTAVSISRANLAIAHNNLGLLLHDLRRYDEALVEYQKSMSINTENDFKLGLSQNLNNQANTYKSQGDYEKSIEFLLQAVAVNKSVNANASIVRNYYNLGETYISLNELNNAEEYFTMAYNMSKQASFAPGIMYNGNGLAKVSIEKEYPRQAIEYAMESLELAEQSNTLDIKVSNYENLSKAYELLNDFQNALEYRKLYQDISDSITVNRTKREIEEVRSNFQFELLSNQNELLEQQVIVYELRFRRQILYLVMLVIIVISIGTILYVINRNKKKIDLKNTQLEILNSEKDTLTKVIVHDLRNPLTGLLGSLELLNDERLNTQQTELVNIAYNSTKKVSEMVDGLLEISRMKDEHIDESIKLTDIKTVCNETIELFRPKAQIKDIKISSRLESISVVTHPPYISRILGNLLSNSLKFSDSSSLIYVETSLDTQSKVWRLKVVDHGPGFTENDKNSAFQMFQKLSATPKTGEHSSGLGLYTVHLLIQKLGGSVTIENNNPKGAIITCEFPLSAQ